MTAKAVFEASKLGDIAALRIVDLAVKHLWVKSVIINPERFVIGGGVSKAVDILFDAIRSHYR